MELLSIVTLLILAQYYFFGLQTGLAHGKAKIPAPAMQGDPSLERRVRIHMNTLEQIVFFIPAMWMFSTYAHASTAIVLGVIFMAGRQAYAWGYMKDDPTKRGPGFAVSFLTLAVVFLGALGGAVYQLLG